MSLVRKRRPVVSAAADGKVHVVMYTCNRGLLAYRLLRDIEREKELVANLWLHDDGSSEAPVDALHVVARNPNWRCVRHDRPHGLDGFWKLVNDSMHPLSALPDRDLILFVPDDVRLSCHAIGRAIAIWNRIDDSSKASLTIQVDRGRLNIQQWTGVDPKRFDDDTWLTQWFDGIGIVAVSALRVLGFKVKGRERDWDKRRSSGTWKYASQCWQSHNLNMYRTDQSLVAIVQTRSFMNPVEREEHPLITAKYAGSTHELEFLANPERVEASLATIPGREEMLHRVLASLYPQVDVLRVFLNNHDHVPEFILDEFPDVTVARSQDHGDIGDGAKFFWAATGRGYQLTCDDDLVYPAGYVAMMVRGIELFQRRAVVTLHGSVVRDLLAPEYWNNRELTHWRTHVPKPVFVHVAGTGCMAYHADTLPVSVDNFRERRNMADIWMAVHCQRLGVPRVVIPHGTRPLVHLNPSDSIYGNLVKAGGDPFQMEVLRRVRNWKVILCSPEVSA